jgi:hypothetical protein
MSEWTLDGRLRRLLAVIVAASSVVMGGCLASDGDEGGEDDVAIDEEAAGSNLLSNGGFEEFYGAAHLPLHWKVATTNGSFAWIDHLAARGGKFGLVVADTTDGNVSVTQVVKARDNAESSVSYELKAWTRRVSLPGTQRLNASCLDRDEKLVKDAEHARGYRFQYLAPDNENWGAKPTIRKFFTCPKGTQFVRVAIVGSPDEGEMRDWDRVVLTRQ